MRYGPSQRMASAKAELILVGIAQDGGIPQAGCACNRCKIAISNPSKSLYPVSCIIRGVDGSVHLLEATRSISHQLGMAARSLDIGDSLIPDSVCLTHAHLGHIDGLGQFGKEAMGLRQIPLFASHSVTTVLGERGLLGPFQLNEKGPGEVFSPSEECGFDYEFIQVPHRDEYSDTHAIKISGPKYNVLFLPDHDSWGQTLGLVGEKSVMSWFQTLSIDFALVDGTFWSREELSDRDFSQVPHPTITRSLELLGRRKEGDPEIIFVHLNHTNPVLDKDGKQRKEVSERGWSIGEQGSIIEL